MAERLNREKNKVILFPKWKEKLEVSSLQALEEKNFKEALTQFNELLKYGEGTHEIIIGKLICLIELGQFEEANDLCQLAMRDKSQEAYYHYVHIYLTLLLQTNRYEDLMERVQKELKDPNMPEVVKVQFQQLYEWSKQIHIGLREEKIFQHRKDLRLAIRENKVQSQWYLVNRLRQLHTKPMEDIYQWLQDPSIHPVIKTSLFQWLQDEQISRTVSVSKLGHTECFIPIKTPSLQEAPQRNKILNHISDIEQKNPSLYDMIKQLLERYLFVTYPLLPNDEELSFIAEAIRFLGHTYMNGQSSEVYEDKLLFYINEIETCEKLYLSILDE